MGSIGDVTVEDSMTVDGNLQNGVTAVDANGVASNHIDVAVPHSSQSTPPSQTTTNDNASTNRSLTTVGM